MSLWICSEHGLYGGQVHCPTCGQAGEWATVQDEPLPQRHAWDDLKEECHINSKWDELRDES